MTAAGAGKQSGLTRIVALRPCGHVAAFRSVEELLRGQAHCPLCAQAKVLTEPPERLKAVFPSGKR